MGHEQVVVAVRVEVARVDAHAGLWAPSMIQRDPRQQRLVPERAIVLVDPELVLHVVVGNIEVDPPIGVDVGGHDPHRPRRSRAPPVMQR